MSWKKEQKSLYLSYDKTYSLLQQIVNYYEFVMIKFYKLLEPVLILTDRVCLTRSKMCFIIKDSRILQKPHFTISLPSCYLLLTANYKFFLITVLRRQCLPLITQTNKSIDLVMRHWKIINKDFWLVENLHEYWSDASFLSGPKAIKNNDIAWIIC